MFELALLERVRAIPRSYAGIGLFIGATTRFSEPATLSLQKICEEHQSCERRRSVSDMRRRRVVRNEGLPQCSGHGDGGRGLPARFGRLQNRTSGTAADL